MIDKPETVSLYQFFQRFPGEEAAHEYFERNRWAGEVTCPHCGSASVATVKSMKPMPYPRTAPARRAELWQKAGPVYDVPKAAAELAVDMGGVSAPSF